jgi:hypothetical protein
MRRIRRKLVAVMAPALMLVAGAAGVGQHVKQFRTPANLECEIPPRDYVQALPSFPALAVSKTAILIRGSGTGIIDPDDKNQKLSFYQLKQATLAVEHCSISRVALAIQSDGLWILSFRADQNGNTQNDPALVAVARPRPPATTSVPKPRPILPGASPVSKYTAHIKRNLFKVRVRGYAAFTTEGTLDGSPGRPVLFQLEPDSFMVQNGIPIFKKFEDKDRVIAKYFDSIDRMEIELSYR